MWSESAGLLRDFAGEGMILTLFLLAVVWLWITEKRKEIKIIFVYMPVSVLAVFLFPLSAKIMDVVLGEEIYYRLLWLWPIVPTIAYAIVQLWRVVKEKSRVLVVVVMVLVIAMSGKVIYLHPNFSSAENQYHIPQVVVDICDNIRIDGREVMVAFPEELVQYVRQYDATICMPYGREVLVESWGWGDRTPLYYVLEGNQPVSVEWAAYYARGHKCHYLVIPVEDKLDGDYEDYGYEVFGTYGGYIVYKDPTQDFSLGQ